MGALRALLRYLIVAIGCLHLCGGHYGVLQVVAWSQMIVEYSGEKGLVQGALDTFDGDHPCSLCISISESKKENKQDPFSPANHQGFELKGLLAPEITSFVSARSRKLPSLGYPDPTPSFSQLSARPPNPPPRMALG